MAFLLTNRCGCFIFLFISPVWVSLVCLYIFLFMYIFLLKIKGIKTLFMKMAPKAKKEGVCWGWGSTADWPRVPAE